MNYIPGFSNYLQAAVPRYAKGGQVMDDMEFSDYGLGGPMLGAEAVGFDLANPRLGGPEQGGSYTGGMGGGSSRTEAERQQSILDVNPYIAPSQGVNLNPITSARSGGQTGYYFTNELGLPARYGEVGLPQAADPATFDPNAKYAASAPGFVPVNQNASYRLVKGGTDGSVVYAGAGEEGLRNVFQQANKLTLDDPKNAYWGVEVLDPATGQYKRVAENQGPNGLGIVGDIAGVALPIAAAIATGGASLGVQIAAGAAAGGLGGFLAGNDPLKSALISGVTAGLGNVTGFNEAVGGALSNAGNAVKNALIPELAKQAATEAGGDIVVNALSNLAKGTASGLLQGAASGVTSGGSPTSAQPTPTQQPVQEPVQRPLDNTIVVSAAPRVSGSGLPFAAAFPVPVNAMLSGALTAAQPTPAEKTAEDIEAEKNPMVVNAYRPINPVGGFDPTSVSKELIGLGGSVAAGLPALTKLAMDPTLAEPAAEDIVVTGNKAIPKTVVPDTLAPVGSVLAGLGLQAIPTPDPALTKKPLGVEDYLSLAGKGVGLLGNIVGGGGGAGQSGTYNRGGGSLNPIFSAKLPSAGGLGTIGANRTVRPMGDQDWLTYGTRPELNFFDYAQPAAPALPTPITTPIPNEPRGPSMYAPDVDNMRFARGGAMPARRGGSTERTEFAVNGPGTGRSDDIPAVLSDGEYVIDAETVALLGDGSSKAGAKKLDDLRVKVRKHKGKKLAKGRFSANAKKPEAYLSGGRI